MIATISPTGFDRAKRTFDALRKGAALISHRAIATEFGVAPRSQGRLGSEGDHRVTLVTMIGPLIINIDVPDLETGISFYETGIGFRLRRLLFERTVAEMDGTAGRIFLIQHPAGAIAVLGTSIVRSYSNHWTPVHLDIAVTDLAAAVERVIAAGAVASGSVSEHAFGRLAPMRDPFGHGFCLIEFNNVGYDAVVSE